MGWAASEAMIQLLVVLTRDRGLSYGCPARWRLIHTLIRNEDWVWFWSLVLPILSFEDKTLPRPYSQHTSDTVEVVHACRNLAHCLTPRLETS
ncbi:hypothetical protein EJ03DRAFT_123895 [Teratosphaeria nubilosa]|uniref:Uncharacterized protein n=1 Tax=Teratosphaeria nubilosa TaxID=161662 RepID=A0A6G1LJY5_9PEZI|nr:hypothetical protein EJ03DRAFT_123895 [Teratosphaeria nubilosa]